MTNEEFQNAILNELKELQLQTDKRFDSIDHRLDSMDQRLHVVDQRLDKIERKLDNVYEQTANLLEFRTETLTGLKQINADQKSIMGVLGEHEIAIRTLQRKPV